MTLAQCLLPVMSAAMVPVSFSRRAFGYGFELAKRVRKRAPAAQLPEQLAHFIRNLF